MTSLQANWVLRQLATEETFRKKPPQNFLQVEGGTYGYGRTVFGVSQKVGSGSLIYGGEVYHEDGPWTHPDNYYKFNGLITYSHCGDANGFSITARGYHGKWNSSDQIAENSVPLVGFISSNRKTIPGWLASTHAIPSSANGLAAKCKTHSASKSATIGSVAIRR